MNDSSAPDKRYLQEEIEAAAYRLQSSSPYEPFHDFGYGAFPSIIPNVQRHWVISRKPALVEGDSESRLP